MLYLNFTTTYAANACKKQLTDSIPMCGKLILKVKAFA